MSNSTARKVKCPYCGNDSIFAPENPFRPFCTERCRLLDLGMWADETFRVPSDEKVSIQDPMPGDDSSSDDE
ncbi:MAG: DNA gyrase inhibitor YacG [Pseudobdellovibrionaceae bacterium]